MKATTAATALSIPRFKSIQVGKDADLVVLDDNYDVLQTYCMGKAQL